MHRVQWKVAVTIATPFFFCTLAVGQVTTFTLQEATVESINNAFDAGLLTSEHLIELYLKRIEAYDQQGPSLNSFITLNPRVLETARTLDLERQTTGPRSVLHGIPVLLKDHSDTFDMPTTSGSLALRDFVPPDDAFIVTKLRDAGAIILGKTNLDEFGCCSWGLSSFGGQTRNPYDTTRIAGGSSSGTAAALAANLGVIGTGADGWGSIQEPAALTSLVGILPTNGLVSEDGSYLRFMTRGAIGPMARTVADAAAMLDVIAGFDPDDPATTASHGNIPDSYLHSLDPTALSGARIGFVTNFLNGANTETRNLTFAATERMESLGADVVTVTVETPGRLLDSWYSDFEYAVNRYFDTLGPDAPFDTLQQLIDSGEILPSFGEYTVPDLNGDIAPEEDPAYAGVVAVRDVFEQEVLGVLDTNQLDALVFPPLLSAAPRITSSEGADGLFESAEDFRNMLASPFLGFPSVTVPAGFRRRGMPFGIEFLGKPFSEPTLIGLAYAFEQATQHRVPSTSTPPLPGETISIGGTDLDCNGDGVIDIQDTNCATGETLDVNLSAAGLLKGDADGDGQVQFSDFAILSHNFGIAGQYSQGDFDKDGVIQFGDFVLLANNFGKTSATLAVVPEPDTHLWFAIGFISVITRTSLVRIWLSPS